MCVFGYQFFHNILALSHGGAVVFPSATAVAFTATAVVEARV
jgi:hypothetical protein